MKGYATSFVGMFRAGDEDTPQVSSIEIPIIQRDYAQGRSDVHAVEVREGFLQALHGALTGGERVGLDFIYGDVVDGALAPLDGQQRLTTLFLLHWYLASRTSRLDPQEPWTRMTYKTRPSARRFCEQLVSHPLPPNFVGKPSTWVKDQPWYLHLWRFDPTVEAMLTMIDAIARTFHDVELESAWLALTRADEPAVWFQLLPVEGMGDTDELYVKMNSRGKPLTPFEGFKAHLLYVVGHTRRADELGQHIDGPWTDLLWPHRGDNNIVDDEFIRFFDLLLELCDWRAGALKAEGERLERRAERLLGEGNPLAGENLDFVIRAFNCWPHEPQLRNLFESLFRTDSAGTGIRLFGAGDGRADGSRMITPHLFLAACQRYGSTSGTVRQFSLTDTLLLYAVMIHLMETEPRSGSAAPISRVNTAEVAERLRVVRNVNEASQFEMRVREMPKFVAEVAAFMRTGDLTALKSYNQNQVLDERRKAAFLSESPSHVETVHALEDHDILRGTLAALTLDSLTARATAFEGILEPNMWSTLTGALIASGEYQRDWAKSDYHLFGSPTTASVWRRLLVDRGDREVLEQTARVLSEVLDLFSSLEGEPRERLDRIREDFLAGRESDGRRDWRYYLAKYERMREGRSGIYYGAHHRLGFEMTMLHKTVQRSHYRDPYLYAIWREAGSPAEVEDPWFSGYSTQARWMRFKRSQIGLRSVERGLIVLPRTEEQLGAIELAWSSLGEVTREADDALLLDVGQELVDGVLFDTRDRVQLGADLMRRLIDTGY